jgi:oligosaccharide 4-alpha-D-glucosyltransferase
MKTRLLLLFILCFIRNIISAQPTSLITQAGKWTFQQYNNIIIKLTFQPVGYSTNENISDAVILKPLPSQKPSAIRIKGDSIFVGNACLIKYQNNNVYKGFQFLLQDDEKIFGGGERAISLNRRGNKLSLYNAPAYGYGEGAENLNYSVPFFTSSKGYALFFDNPSKGYADIGKTNRQIFETGFVSGELNVYIILGKSYQSILSSYHLLTGTQPIPPRWALGNLISRFGYTSESQVKGIVGKMEQQQIPFDAVIFYLFWFGDSIKHTMGNLDWTNKRKWPTPQKMIHDFKQKGIKTILITEPFVVQSSTNYTASKPFLAVDSLNKVYSIKNFYFGEGGLIDIFRTEAQNWFWQFYKKQMDKGVEAWWGDLGEPETHPSDLHHNLKDYGHTRLFNADEVHNIYGHQWTKMLFDKYSKFYPNKRLFSLNRSGFAGTQRYGIFPWSGDVGRNWSGLRAQLNVMLGMTMSGVPYAHADAGGFAGGDGDNELYVRWLQFATFTPIFRPHGTALYDIDKNAFSFPSEAALIDSPYRNYAKETVQLRYSLLPYNYTLAYEQTKNAQPLAAPLYYYFENDTTASAIEDEFMWGAEMLIAPVLHKNESERKIYLPEGNWYNYHTSVSMQGSRWITEKLTLHNIPVFVKEGSFIPTIGRIKNTGEYAKRKVVLKYYPSNTQTNYSWYDDDGISKNALAQHKFTLVKCTGQDDGKTIKIVLEANNSLYLKNAFTISIAGINQTVQSVIVNGRKIKNFSATAEAINIPVQFNGKRKINVEIEKL